MIERVLDKLVELQKTMSEDTFNDIFGNPMGSHIWEKFRRMEYSLTWLYNGLDLENRKKLCDWLEQNGSFTVLFV